MRKGLEQDILRQPFVYRWLVYFLLYMCIAIFKLIFELRVVACGGIYELKFWRAGLNRLVRIKEFSHFIPVPWSRRPRQ